MYKLKQIAPFFGLEPREFKKILDEINLVHPFQTTVLGTFRIKNEDIVVIELYLNIKKLFPQKKESIEQLRLLLKERNNDSNDSEWLKAIKEKNSSN